MTENFRHHRVSREIIFVEVPTAGSPKSVRTVKPGRYPVDKHQPWKPATRPPSKAEKLVRFLDRINRQDSEVRAYMAGLLEVPQRLDQHLLMARVDAHASRPPVRGAVHRSIAARRASASA